MRSKGEGIVKGNFWVSGLSTWVGVILHCNGERWKRTRMGKADSRGCSWVWFCHFDLELLLSLRKDVGRRLDTLVWSLEERPGWNHLSLESNWWFGCRWNWLGWRKQRKKRREVWTESWGVTTFNGQVTKNRLAMGWGKRKCRSTCCPRS